MSEQVNVVKFKSSKGNFYIFDAKSNNIYKVDESTYSSNITCKDLGHDNELRNTNNNQFNIKNSVENEAKTLIIEITEQCNLRCSYCIFDEESQLERNHGTTSITKQSAEKSVLNFSKRVSGNGYIVFYGGEPTMAFEQIKNIVNYANNLKGKSFKYSFTTNGYSIKDEHIKFIVENDFKVTFSLDGDKETHDKYRVTKNGLGTFDKIISNINKIRDYAPDYFKRNILLNCVISETTDIESLNEFFFNLGVDLGSLQFSPIRQSGDFVANNITNSILSNQEIPTTSNPIEKNKIDEILSHIRYRKLDSQAHEGKKKCIPFSDRTYVRTNGNVQFCERIGNYSELHDDVSVLKDASKRIWDHFYSNKSDDCSRCYAYNFCQFCPASFITNGKLDIEGNRYRCSNFRKLVAKSLSFYADEMEAEVGNAG